MKFCPQCGTPFEPDARFCSDCGFDRMSVDESASVPEAKEIPETGKAACPGCGGELIPGDRFCQECGFDSESDEKPAPPEISEPLRPAFIPVPEPVIPPVKKIFCLRCGSELESSERFCANCGFDTVEGKISPPPPEKKPEPVSAAPIPVPPPPVAVPPRKTPAPLHPEGNKKNRMLPVYILAAVCLLAAGGWFAWDYFSPGTDEVTPPVTLSPPETTGEPASTPTEPAVSPTSAETPEATKPTAKPAAKSNTKTPAPSKPTSRVDQELAKYRENEKMKIAQSSPAVDNSKVKSLLEIGKKETPKMKNPRNPVKLVLKNATMIARITTDHYNGGMGTPSGGTITISDRDGKTYGTFRASAKTGANGTPNAKWVAEPRKILDAGTYLISDSDNATWSKNLIGNGFVVVEGYEIK
jgi:predicted amidophosphoribosyltransferase